jgi:hypothetical protein
VAVLNHKFPRADTFQITLTVTDSGGARATAQRNFRVYTGDDPGPDPGPGPVEGECTTPSKLREPFFFTVISGSQSSKTLVGQFHEQVSCSQVFYLCGDVRIGGIRPGEKEYWIGTICEMFSLGNNRFQINLRQGTSWPDVGESGTYVWPQLDCNPAVVCR